MSASPISAETLYAPRRRKTVPVTFGGVTIGGDAPVLVQSMTTTNARDVDATVAETLALAKAGCRLVRITAPTEASAAALKDVVAKVRAAGCDVAISADIHFQPRAAYEAVKWVDKVRINPGNFVDRGIQSTATWDDVSWAEAVARVEESFGALVEMAKEGGVAIRIGTNHGSLSQRMVWKYGDTVEGMVESALEYLRVCEAHDFHDVVFSMKSSNPKVVVEAYRMLAARLDSEFRPYPLHVGVTEAGEGEDGRLKSSVGIGALLLDGLGDTVRVSLTEPPVAEIPVAAELVRLADVRNQGGVEFPKPLPAPAHDPFRFSRRAASRVECGPFAVGGNEPLRVAVDGSLAGAAESGAELVSGRDFQTFGAAEPGLEAALAGDGPVEIRVSSPAEFEAALGPASRAAAPLLWSWCGPDGSETVGTRWLAAALRAAGREDPLVLRAKLPAGDAGRMSGGARIGSLLVDGIGDLVCVDAAGDAAASAKLGFDLLQASGRRRTRTEYISCPSCGRTLYDLVSVTEKIKARTSHLADVAIGIMGCIVNGPGEMADADFGYVGGAPGKIDLYVKRECVKKGIPSDQAVEALVELIKAHGRWKDPV